MPNASYKEGPEAREKFDKGMSKLFRAPKIPLKQATVKPPAKPKKTSKD